MGSRGSSAVGVIVSVLIVGAVVSLGYFQFEVAPYLTTSTSSTTSVSCTPSTCVNITIPSGANAPTSCSGYTPGGKTTCGYSPDSLTLVMGTNNTVVWSSSDVPAIHTATDSGVFDSGDLTTVPYQFTFTATGTYHYTCKYHAWMQGTIIVKAA